MVNRKIYNGLVVDDEAPIRMATTRALAAEGIVCDVASNGAQALDRIRQSKYDLVVTDLRMPETNGHSLAIELLSLPQRPLVVVLTGVLEPKLANDLKARGVDDVQFKPVDFREFAATVRWLADQRAAAAKAEADRSANANSSEPLAAGMREPVSAPTEQSLALQITALAAQLPTPSPEYDAFKALSSGSFSIEDVSAALKQDPDVVAAVLSIFNRALFSSSTRNQGLEQLMSAITEETATVHK